MEGFLPLGNKTDRQGGDGFRKLTPVVLEARKVRSGQCTPAAWRPGERLPLAFKGSLQAGALARGRAVISCCGLQVTS